MNAEIVEIKSEEKIRQTRKIWYDSFTRDNTYLDRYFSGCFPHIDTYGIEEGGEIISVASLIDVIYGEFKLRYLYGVATSPIHRGKGLSTILFHELVRICEQEKADAIITRPAEPSLFSLYRSMGMTTSLWRNETRTNADSLIGFSAAHHADTCLKQMISHPDARALSRLLPKVRERYSTGTATGFASDKVTEFALSEILADGGAITEDGSGYTYFSTDGETILVSPSGNNSRTTARDLAAVLLKSGGIYTNIKIISNVSDDAYQDLGRTEKTEYGLGLILGKKLSLEKMPRLEFLME